MKDAKLHAINPKMPHLTMCGRSVYLIQVTQRQANATCKLCRQGRHWLDAKNWRKDHG